MIDTATITVKAGNGGDGCISLHREKFVPYGGPDGGDGGRGGNVILNAAAGQHMLQAFRYRRNFVAGDGKHGQGDNRTGRGGEDCNISVPVGTTVVEIGENGEKREIGDLAKEGQQITVAWGGEGGKGNRRFARAQNQVPLLAEAGEVGRETVLQLELHLLADVAIVGMPSVGKSLFLRACSNARPDVAEYPFTTLEPVLGFVERKKHEFVLVEIPGLIEGAHRGVGLGHEFLRHMRRTRGLIHILDGTSEHILLDYHQVREEMRLYDEGLLSKPEIVVVNKVDISEVSARRREIETLLSTEKVSSRFISAATREGVEEVLDSVLEMLQTQEPTEALKEIPPPILTPKPKHEGVTIEKRQDDFVVRSSRAERIVRRVDMNDWGVQAQLWGELKRMGIARALKRAGARAGSTVRIGDWELEWK